jgi:hypothetical protein
MNVLGERVALPLFPAAAANAASAAHIHTRSLGEANSSGVPTFLHSINFTYRLERAPAVPEIKTFAAAPKNLFGQIDRGVARRSLYLTPF